LLLFEIVRDCGQRPGISIFNASSEVYFAWRAIIIANSGRQASHTGTLDGRYSGYLPADQRGGLCRVYPGRFSIAFFSRLVFGFFPGRSGR